MADLCHVSVSCRLPVDLFSCLVVGKRVTMEARRLQKIMFLTGPVIAVKGVKTTGSHSSGAVKTGLGLGLGLPMW